MGGEAFFIYQLLGQGGFAKVFRAVTDDNKTFAIKVRNLFKCCYIKFCIV